MAIIISLIILLVLFFAAIVVLYVIYQNVRRKIRSFSNELLGTSSLFDGFNQIQQEYSTTPKSVSAATSLHLPRISKDFPDFHYEEMKVRAENVLTSYLRAMDQKEALHLSEGTNELRNKLAMQIEMLDARQTDVHYDNVRIHRTEINQYKKDRARCSIMFQSAVEYVYYAETNGNVTGGNKNYKTQSKYNVELIYIQDREIIEKTSDKALAVNCPNCGAPLSGVGAKICAYCDSPIVEFNIRSWNFSDVEEVK